MHTLRGLAVDDNAVPVRRLRWGVLGCAGTARKRFLPALLRSGLAEPVAVASRSRAKAEVFAQDFGFRTAYGDYDALLRDPAVEAVYLPLPISEHVDWCVRAIEHGKHVLCEKPLASTRAGVAAIARARASRPELQVAEGFMYRFHPRWLRARALLRDGAIGRPLAMSMAFCFRNVVGDNIRNQLAMEGGALNDAGCYLVSATRFLLGREPERVVATSRHDGPGSPDASTMAVLDFGDCSASCLASLRAQRTQSVVVHGETGTLRLETAFDIAADAPSSIECLTDAGRSEESFEPFDQFRAQIDAFCRAVLEPSGATTGSLEDSLRNATALEAVRRSAAGAGWVPVASA